MALETKKGLPHFPGGEVRERTAAREMGQAPFFVDRRSCRLVAGLKIGAWQKRRKQ
jgi:hypothetical protein